MKRQTFMVTGIILLTTLGFIGCKKEDTKKDYNSILKNSVWTGEFNYTGAIPQPFSVEFKEGGQFTWFELSGEYTGSWKIENDLLNVSFATGSGFKAGISNDNKLMNIQNLPSNKWALVHAELNSVADESLDLTTWTASNLKLNFKAGNKVDMELGPTGSTKYKDISYIRKGRSLRYDVLGGAYKWFIVNNTKSVYKGINTFTGSDAIYPFDMTKN